MHVGLGPLLHHKILLAYRGMDFFSLGVEDI